MAGALLLDLGHTLVEVQACTDYDTAWADVLALVADAPVDLGPETSRTTATRACMAAQLPDAQVYYDLADVLVRVH